MAVTIGSNIVSLNAQRQLGKATESLSTISERLSSGQRINKASDDAAGLAVSTSLNSQVRIFGQSIRNLNDGITVNAISDGATQNMTEVLDRISELTTQSLNGTFNQKQRNVMDLEAQALRSEFNRIVDTTTFNGIKLFDENSDIRIQAGNSTVNGSIALNSSNLGVGAENNGQFTLSTNTNLNFNLKGAAYGDFNNDGTLDIAASLATERRIYLGNGDGSFKYKTNFFGESSQNYTNSQTGDINNDGNLDFVLGPDSATTNTVEIYYGNGDGNFRRQILDGTHTGSTAIYDVELGDLNKDGVLDIVTGNLGSASTIFMSNADGSFKAASVLPYNGLPGVTQQISDVNNDGILDVIGSNGNAIVVLRGSSSAPGTLTALALQDIGSTLLSFDTGDINGDGILDIVGNNFQASPTAALRTFIGNGDGTFKIGNTVPLPNATDMAGYPISPTFAKDMNGDGKVDAFTIIANGSLILATGNGNGTFNVAVSIAGQSGTNFWDEGIIADFNNDDIQDIAFSQEGAAGAIIFFGQGSRVSTLNEFSIKDFGSSKSTLNMIERARNNLLQGIGKIGADRSRLTSAVNVLRVQRENYFAAGSRIMDSDVASESSDYAATKIRQQAAVSVLAQANLQPQIALQLLRG